ncbi:hypothetical protein SASPL_115078 [Salvia splendens]|uniref:Transferase n=1 Tax=Salvia splendens TaxID=180675 RepID=A0A8X8Y4W3_SALSN|nr:hypothetical protein SASPL_115078 [Salvia splendens]
MEKIKPSSPTPPHLRVYNTSLIDQTMIYGYAYLVLYYLGNYSKDKIQHLKESLSRTLVTFYPFAGIIKDALSADCNDQGLPFSVAKVEARMSDFLQNPNVELMNKFYPTAEKLLGMGDSIMVIQLNCFDCGSIAMSIKFHHLIADMVSISTFLQHWAANAQGLGLSFPPLNRIAQSSFSQKPSLSNNQLPFNYFSKYLISRKFVLRRYVFDASALSILKAQTSSFRVSRVNVVTAVIRQCFIEAVTEESAGKDMKPILMSQGVNLRRKAMPPFPDDSFGNLAWNSKSLWSFPKEKELTELLREVKKEIAKIDGEFVRRLGSEGAYDFLEELRNEMPQEATFLAMTSWANIGLSEIDFGGGKPVWMSSFIPHSSEVEKGCNLAILLDSKSGGIEAWTTLDEKYVAGFEKNDYIRKYARFNPSVI